MNNKDYWFIQIMCAVDMMRGLVNDFKPERQEAYLNRYKTILREIDESATKGLEVNGCQWWHSEDAVCCCPIDKMEKEIAL